VRLELLLGASDVACSSIGVMFTTLTRR
jgi:hypothetical protein